MKRKCGNLIIKVCPDCPNMSNDTYICHRHNRYYDKYIIPDWCTLKKVGKNENYR